MFHQFWLTRLLGTLGTAAREISCHIDGNFILFCLTNVHLYEAVIWQVSDGIMFDEKQTKQGLSHVQNNQLNRLSV